MQSRLIGIALAALVLTASAYGNVMFATSTGGTAPILPGGQSILFTPKATGTTIIGTVGSNMVQFSDPDGLVVSSSGKEIDPQKGVTLHDITIMSSGNIFTGLVFDAFGAKHVPPDVQVVVKTTVGPPSSTTIGGTSAHDWLLITTGGGEQISDVTITSASGFTHLRGDAIAGLAPAPIIPEPSSILLLGSGVLGLAQVLRRKLL